MFSRVLDYSRILSRNKHACRSKHGNTVQKKTLMLNLLIYQSSRRNFYVGVETWGVMQRFSFSDSSPLLSPYYISPSLEHQNGEGLSISKWVFVTLKFIPGYAQKQFAAYQLFCVLSDLCPSLARATSDHHVQPSSTWMAVKCTILNLLQRRYLTLFWTIYWYFRCFHATKSFNYSTIILKKNIQ